MKFRGKLSRSVVVQKFSKVLNAKNEATAERAESSSTMQSSDKDVRCDSASVHRDNGPSSSQEREHSGEQDIEDKAVISSIQDSTISAPDQIDSQDPTPDETKSGGSRSSRDDVSQGPTPEDTKSQGSWSSRDDASTWYSRRTGGTSYTSDSSYYTESVDESVVSPSYVLDAIHEFDWYFDGSEPTHLEVIESFSSYETGDSQSTCSSQSETDAIDQTSHKTDKSTSAKKQGLLPEENSKCEENEHSIDKGETAATINSSSQEAVSDQGYEVQYARPPATCDTSLSEDEKITDGAESNFGDEGKDASESQSGRRVENKNPILQRKNSTSTASVAFEMTVLDHLQQKKKMDAGNISITSGLPELGSEKPIEDGFERALSPAKVVFGNGNNNVIDDGVEESLSTYLQWKTEAVATRDRNLRFTQRHKETAKKCSEARDGNVYGKWRNFLLGSKRSAEDRGGQCHKGAATGPPLRPTEKDTSSNHELVRNKMEVNADKTGTTMSPTKRNKTIDDAVKRDARSSDMLRDRIAEKPKIPTNLVQSFTKESHEKMVCLAPEIQVGPPRSDDRGKIQGNENNLSAMIDNSSGTPPILDFWKKIMGEDPEDIRRSMSSNEQSDIPIRGANTQPEELQGSVFGSWLAPFTSSSVACEHCKKHFSFVDSKVEEYVGNPRSGVKSMFHTSCRQERALLHGEKRKALRQIALYGYLKRRRAPTMQSRKMKKLKKQQRHEQSKLPERVEKTNVLNRIFGRRTKNSPDKVQSNREDSEKAEMKSLVRMEERKLVAFHESNKTTGHGKTYLQVHNLGSREVERKPLKPPTTRQRSLSPKKKMEHQDRETRVSARLTAPGHPRSPLRGQVAPPMIKPKRSGTLSPVPCRVMNEPSNPRNQKAHAKFNDRQRQSTHLGSPSRPCRRQEDVAVRRPFGDTGKGKSPKTMLASQERSSKTWGKPVDTTTATLWTPVRGSSRPPTDEKVWTCRKSPYKSAVDQAGRVCTQKESYNNNNRNTRGAGPQTSAIQSSRFAPSSMSLAMKESRDYNYLVDPEVAFRMVPTEKYLRPNPTQPMRKRR